MVHVAPDDSTVRAMLAEALAQYRARPGDYLEGVVVGLMRELDSAADRSWCDDAAQDRNAGHRTAQHRVRDYLNGSKAAMAWAAGDTSQPPLTVVLTEGKPPDGQAQP